MAHGSDGDAGDEVDVCVPVGVVDAAALAPRHGEAGVQGEGLQARRHVTLLELDDLLRARPGLDAAADLRHREAPIATAAREKRAASRAAIFAAATERKSAKLGQAFKSMTEMAPAGDTMASPP